MLTETPRRAQFLYKIILNSTIPSNCIFSGGQFSFLLSDLKINYKSKLTKIPTRIIKNKQNDCFTGKICD